MKKKLITAEVKEYVTLDNITDDKVIIAYSKKKPRYKLTFHNGVYFWANLDNSCFIWKHGCNNFLNICTDMPTTCDEIYVFNDIIDFLNNWNK